MAQHLRIPDHHQFARAGGGWKKKSTCRPNYGSTTFCQKKIASRTGWRVVTSLLDEFQQAVGPFAALLCRDGPARRFRQSVLSGSPQIGVFRSPQVEADQQREYLDMVL